MTLKSISSSLFVGRVFFVSPFPKGQLYPYSVTICCAAATVVELVPDGSGFWTLVTLVGP